MSRTVMTRRAEDQKVGRRRWRPTGSTLFLGALLLVFIAYTEIAFGMEWVTDAGRIGGGAFPLAIGVVSILAILICIVHNIRAEISEPSEGPNVPQEDEFGQADLGRHPKALIASIAACAAFVFTLISLGAIVSGTLFLFGMLWFLNPGRHITNVSISIGLPVAMYLLLQTFLNAGLPAGILPDI